LHTLKTSQRLKKFLSGSFGELLMSHSQGIKCLFKEHIMSIWQILGSFAVSDSGDTVHKISDSLSISTNGTSYTTMGLTTVGSDGSVFIQQGCFSSDGSTRMGSVATGLGAVFSQD
jgi:hypothetical protein